ncbi:MAG: thiamine diphosphokinase [Peptococcaceae bacterium]|jgi:thiamine pyrophosphokinase|nr:thiamine diphosphokinase [Peptococcaceae bacterium]MDH7524283.1 thiamine diphosphokinase [Peptococcaceae bacterium]
MKNKKCLIISGGCLETGPFYQALAQEAHCVICADGGARHAAALGIVPALAVGDFDTLTEKELAELAALGTKIIRCPREKDYTDTQMALEKALEMGFQEIDIVAALGGRLDHALANVMLLALPKAEEARIRLLDEDQEVFLIRRKTVLRGKLGETISLLPLSEEVSGIRTRGLYYQVDNGRFVMGIPVGVSNVFSEETAEIEIEKGLLLAIRVRNKQG